MFNHQFFVSLKRAMRLETVKHFVQVHQDRIKTVALPLLVIAAVLFFWIYGNVQDGESIRVEDAAADAQQTEDVQDDGTAGADAAEQTPQGDIYVDICGEVVRPGVYQIASGTRLFEVIAQAGGLTAEADINVINQAEVVYDGQKIRILSYAETSQEVQTASDPSGGQGGSQGSSDGKVNINRADAAALQTIPGIGPSKAERIIDYRNTAGPFQSIEDIKNVSGIGNKTFESIREYLTVS